MKLKPFMISLGLIALLVSPALSFSKNTDPPSKPPFSLSPMLEKVTPAVVKLTIAKANVAEPFETTKAPSNKQEVGLGSGVIVDANQGIIVTNAHVVSRSQIIVVTLKNGRSYIGTLVGEDDGFDIGVVKINAKGLNAIPFGDSDQLQVGDYVAAIGSPFGLSQTVTSGVISAINRSEPKIEGYQSFIQTDTPINPGNSGGALVNMKGEFIGMNTALVSPLVGNVGIGFAIPSNMVKSVAQQLVQYGNVTRGMLGVIAQNITPSLADALHLKSDHGAVVTQTIPNSPADKSGLKIADIILSLNGKNISSSEQIRNSLAMMRPGTNVSIDILRNGKNMTINATTVDPKTLTKQQELPFIGGMSLQNFNELESDGTVLQGVQVTGMSDISAAALAGIEPGDVIIKANQQPITSINELKNIALKTNHQLLLQISRNNTGLFLVIDKDDQ